MRMMSRIAMATGLAMLSTLAIVPLAGAQTPTAAPSDEPTKAERRKQEAEQRKLEAEKRAAEKRAELQQKLKEKQQNPKTGQSDQKKIDRCKAVETRIRNLMDRQSSRGAKQLELIGAIVTRVQTYKTDKNLTVANYDAFLADVEAKKIAAEAAIANAQNAQVDFNCESADPKKAGEVVQEFMKAQHEALKAYKEAAIKLLIAVKQSQGNGGKAPAPAPSPTSPTPTTPPAGPTPPSTNPTPAPNPEEE